MFRTLIARFIAWQKQDVAIATLQSFDDALLADMGIARDRISELVRGKARR